MFFAFDITVGANTAASSPKKQTLKLTKGVITKLDIFFPPGCHGLVKVRLFRSAFQLVPLSKDEWITGDSAPVETEGFYDLETSPPELEFVGCSPGTTYDHTITVRVQILPKSIATVGPLVDLLMRFLRHIGALG